MDNYVYEGRSGADVYYESRGGRDWDDKKGCDDDKKGCDDKKSRPCKMICETKRLAGVKFELRAKCGCVIACGRTNENGELKFDCLPCGTYFLVEVEPRKGWNCDRKPICIEITGENPHKCVEVINRRDNGSIKVIKLGKEERFVCDDKKDCDDDKKDCDDKKDDCRNDWDCKDDDKKDDCRKDWNCKY